MIVVLITLVLFTLCMCFNRDQQTFSMVHLQQASPNDLNLRVQNLVEVVRNVKRFYQVTLQLLLG